MAGAPVVVVLHSDVVFVVVHGAVVHLEAVVAVVPVAQVTSCEHVFY